MNKQVLTLLIVITAALSSGCQSKASDEIDYGTIENSVYKNEYFGLSLTVPDGWSVQDRAAQKHLQDMGNEVVSGNDRNLKKIIKASEMQTVSLLMAFKHPMGTPVDFNPSIICLAERVRHMPGIKRGKDYHAHAKKLLQRGQLRVSFPKPISTEQVGGRDFDVMYTAMSVAGMKVRQKQYATIMKGYALAFALSYQTDAEEAELQKVLDSVTLD